MRRARPLRSPRRRRLLVPGPGSCPSRRRHPGRRRRRARSPPRPIPRRSTSRRPTCRGRRSTRAPLVSPLVGPRSQSGEGRELGGDLRALGALGADHEHGVVARDGAEHVPEARAVERRADHVGRPRGRAQHDEAAAVRDVDHELAHHASEVVVGRARLLGVLGDRVRHRPAGDADLHRAEVLEVTADRRLGGDDPVRRQELDQLGLARHGLLLEQARDAVLALGLAERRHHAPPPVASSARSARTASIRLAACCQTSEEGPSITSAVTSSPRCAGRQCRNTAWSPAAVMRSPSTRYPRNAAWRVSDSCSWPIDVHTSVYTASAPFTASYGSTASSTAPPRLPARSTTSSSSSYPGGDATVSSMPHRAEAKASEAATLFPSPTNTTRRPSSDPRCSRSVRTSASAWHGWARSDRRFTTGTSTAAAMASSVVWSNTRAARIVQYPASVRATSSTLSRTPIPTSSGRM